MSGIAEVLLNLDFNVTGSDKKETDVTERLRNLGADISLGHDEKNIDIFNPDVVVTSTAIDKRNPEVIAAQLRKIPVIPRAEMLAELMRLKYSIAIAGCHGKTTTTSMVSLILASYGLDPTVVIGGRFNNFGTGAKLGKGEYLVAEADESDGSFLKLYPTFAIVTNIDNDHLDHYGNIENIKNAFIQFVNKIPFYGYAVLCNENELLTAVLPHIKRRYFTYGFRESADYRAVNIQTTKFGNQFDVLHRDKILGRVDLRTPGKHNVLNSLASIVCCLELEIPFEAISAALSEFGGIGRRLEKRGEYKNVVFIDDYGHHPTEINATLEAIRSIYPGRRIYVLFQPHRYTRTALLTKQFGYAFSNADVIKILDIYAASEQPIEGVSSELIINAVKKSDSRNISKFESVEKTAAELLDGDIVVTLGAGDIWKKADSILSVLKDVKSF